MGKIGFKKQDSSEKMTPDHSAKQAEISCDARLSVDIQKSLGKFRLNIQFEHDLGRGILGILGSSGCGKSMTLRCISGVDRPDSGRIALGDTVFFSSEDKVFVRPRNRGVGHLFQDYALFPNMTVRGNILAGMRGDKRDHSRDIDQLLHAFYIGDQAHKYPRELSGGQKQRTALARVFASRPSILLLDEPFSALDEYLRYQLEQNLFEYLEQYRGIVLYVSHNRDEIRRFCDYVLVVEDGKAISYMPVADLFESPWHFASARLAGIRNFSHAEKRGPREIFAVEWNTLLTTADAVPDDLQYIGVRENAVRILPRGSMPSPSGSEDGRAPVMSPGNRPPDWSERGNAFGAAVLRIVPGITADTAVLIPFNDGSDELFGKIFVTLGKTHLPLHAGDEVIVAIADDDIMCLK